LETDKVLESPGIFFSKLEIIEELLPAQGLLPKCLFSPISFSPMSFFFLIAFLSLSLRIKVR
jgi:hypothetical protein